MKLPDYIQQITSSQTEAEFIIVFAKFNVAITRNKLLREELIHVFLNPGKYYRKLQNKLGARFDSFYQQVIQANRSPLAEQLHNIILRAIDAKTKRNLRESMREFEIFFTNNEPIQAYHALLESSVHGFTHINDIINLIKHNAESIAFKEKITITLLTALRRQLELGVRKKHLTSLQVRALLSNVTEDGFTILEHALMNESPAVFLEAFSWFSTELSAQEITQVLTRITIKGFTVLHSAVSQPNRITTLVLFEILEQKLTFAEMKLILAAITESGFTVLQFAALNQHIIVVKKLLQLFTKYLTNDEQRAVCLTRNADEWNILHQCTHGNSNYEVLLVCATYITTICPVDGPQVLKDMALAKNKDGKIPASEHCPASNALLQRFKQYSPAPYPVAPTFSKYKRLKRKPASAGVSTSLVSSKAPTTPRHKSRRCIIGV